MVQNIEQAFDSVSDRLQTQEAELADHRIG